MLFIVVTLAVLLSRYTFLALLLTICGGCTIEFYRLAQARGAQPMKIFGTAAGIMLLLLSFFTASRVYPVTWFAAAFIITVVIPFVGEMYRNREDPIANIGSTLTGILYVTLPLSLLCYIAFSAPVSAGAAHGYAPWVVLSYIYIIWMNDVGAYLVGITIGKHRLFERLSPKKSWEGFFGGLVFAIGLSLLLAWIFGWSMMFWAGLAVVAVIGGVLGDLVESMFKRAAGVKDSGAIMPGHGGFLDRFDALLLSAPLVFLYFLIFA